MSRPRLTPTGAVVPALAEHAELGLEAVPVQVGGSIGLGRRVLVDWLIATGPLGSGGGRARGE